MSKTAANLLNLASDLRIPGESVTVEKRDLYISFFGIRNLQDTAPDIHLIRCWISSAPLNAGCPIPPFSLHHHIRHNGGHAKGPAFKGLQMSQRSHMAPHSPGETPQFSHASRW